MISQLREVFSKDYAKETFFRKKTLEAVNVFKLKNQSESIEEKIARLRDSGYKSNFEVKADYIE